jgi:hypothetical protein
LEAHADTEFGDGYLVEGFAYGVGEDASFVVGLEHHGAATEADRSARRFETGYDFVWREWGGGLTYRFVEVSPTLCLRSSVSSGGRW